MAVSLLFALPLAADAGWEAAVRDIEALAQPLGFNWSKAQLLSSKASSTYAFPPPVDLDAYAAACRLPPAEETEDEREARFQRERCFGL